ncbi:MAG: TRAP transporter small permease subunit [Bacteroidetes bacterium]|nr:TRAP transporter small permease subunit [Bacteroidota bacterium]
MNSIKTFIRFTDKLNNKLGAAVSWLTGILVLIVSIDVFLRYFLESSFAALQELEWHLFSIIFLLGAAYTLQTDNHVRVDLFYSKFSLKNKAIINLIGSIVFFIPFCLLVIYSSKNFVLQSFKIGETSPDPGGLPALYILKSILPLSFIFLLLQALVLFFKSLLTIKENKDN